MNIYMYPGAPLSASFACVGLLERILQRLNQESGEMQIEVPEDYLTLHDLRLSPIHLRRKMHIGQRLDLFENKMGAQLQLKISMLQ